MIGPGLQSSRCRFRCGLPLIPFQLMVRRRATLEFSQRYRDSHFSVPGVRHVAEPKLA